MRRGPSPRQVALQVILGVRRHWKGKRVAMSISEKQAYAAMYAFLSHWYEMTQSDDIGSLLGSMSLLPDGSTADPAIESDWQEALSKAKSGKVDPALRFVGP